MLVNLNGKLSVVTIETVGGYSHIAYVDATSKLRTAKGIFFSVSGFGVVNPPPMTSGTVTLTVSAIPMGQFHALSANSAKTSLYNTGINSNVLLVRPDEFMLSASGLTSTSAYLAPFNRYDISASVSGVPGNSFGVRVTFSGSTTNVIYRTPAKLLKTKKSIFVNHEILATSCFIKKK